MADNPDANYEALLSEDPGDPVFCEYAEQLRLSGNFPKALDVCLKGLSSNPGFHKGRLALARIFYEQGYLPFAIREVKELAEALPNNRYVQRLYRQLAPDSVEVERAADTEDHADDEAGSSDISGSTQSSVEDETVAEVDFDFDELEMIEEDD